MSLPEALVLADVLLVLAFKIPGIWRLFRVRNLETTPLGHQLRKLPEYFLPVMRISTQVIMVVVVVVAAVEVLILVLEVVFELDQYSYAGAAAAVVVVVVVVVVVAAE